MANFPVIPSRMALINVDIQNCFVEGSAPDGLLVLDRINRLAQVCREIGIAVFHIRHALSAGLDPGVLGEIFPILKKAYWIGTRNRRRSIPTGCPVRFFVN